MLTLTPIRCAVSGEDIAEEIVWVASRPEHVQVAQIRKSSRSYAPRTPFSVRPLIRIARSHLPHCAGLGDDQPPQIDRVDRMQCAKVQRCKVSLVSVLRFRVVAEIEAS